MSLSFQRFALGRGKSGIKFATVATLVCSLCFTHPTGDLGVGTAILLVYGGYFTESVYGT